MKRIIVVGLCALALAACGKPAPVTGTIIAKHDNKEHREWVDTSFCASYDSKTFACNMYISDGYWRTVPENWELCLKADPGDKDHEMEGCFYIDKDTFNNRHVGEHYPDLR